MLRLLINKLFGSNAWIAPQPADTDDEAVFGFLASDIGRQTGIFPGHIKRELDKMVTFGNPLAIKFTKLAEEGLYPRSGREFDELCMQIDRRIDISLSGPNIA